MTTDTDTVLRGLADSPEGKAILAAAEERRLADRASRVKRIEQLKKETLEANKRQSPLRASAAEAVRTAERALTSAREKQATVEGESLALIRRPQQECQQLEIQQHTTADPRIDVFMHEMSRDDARTCNASASIESRTRRLETVRAARVSADAMKMQALSGEEVSERIDSLRAGLSSLEDSPREVTNIFKGIPGSAAPSLRSRK